MMIQRHQQAIEDEGTFSAVPRSGTWKLFYAEDCVFSLRCSGCRTYRVRGFWDVGCMCHDLGLRWFALAWETCVGHTHPKHFLKSMKMVSLCGWKSFAGKQAAGTRITGRRSSAPCTACTFTVQTRVSSHSGVCPGRLSAPIRSC